MRGTVPGSPASNGSTTATGTGRASGTPGAGTIDLAIPKLRQGYLQNSWKMAGVQIRQIWNGARLDHNNRPVDQIGGYGPLPAVD